MESNNTPPLSEEMRLLLVQMRRTTSLIAARLENTVSSTPLASTTATGSTACSQSATVQCSLSAGTPPVTPHSSIPESHTSTCTTAYGISPSYIPPTYSLSRDTLPSTPHVQHPTLSLIQQQSPGPLSSCREDDIQRNLARLFRPYNLPVGGGRGPAQRRKKEVPWSHTFVCLPEPDMVSVPTSEEAKFYEACGIGRKLVTFPKNTGDHSYLSELLYSVYPPLRDAGGFTLNRSDRTKRLTVIPIPACGYSLEFLRCGVDIKRSPLYIIPLQRGLRLNPPNIEISAVMEKCLSCERDFPLCEMTQHIKTCDRARISEEALHLSDEGTDEENEDVALALYQSLKDIEVDSGVVQVDPVVQAEESPAAIVIDELEDAQDNDFVSIMKDLRSQVDPGPSPPHNSINVTRESVMESAFRALRRQRFNPLHRIDVVFMDHSGQSEGAVDDGGPSREFFRLLVVAIKDSIYFSGDDSSKNLTLVSRALAAGEYKCVGQMLCLALVHGGIKPSFFSERLYCNISGQPTSDVTLEEVDDWDLRGKLQKISGAETVTEAQEAVEEASGSLSLLGCCGYLQTLEQRDTLVKDAAKAYVEGRNQNALKQFMEGLQTLRVADAIKKHPGTMKTLFVGGQKEVQLQDLLDLFSMSFSSYGSNRRRLENQTVAFWKDWLIEVDEGTRPVTLGQILIFASGTDSIPPLGFPHRPTIAFLHCEGGNQRIFPEANTCEVTLRLPLHVSYTAFVEHMESGIIQCPTFGFA